MPQKYTSPNYLKQLRASGKFRCGKCGKIMDLNKTNVARDASRSSGWDAVCKPCRYQATARAAEKREASMAVFNLADVRAIRRAARFGTGEMKP